MKKSFTNFKELKTFIDNDDSSNKLKGTKKYTVSNFEDATDAFISHQRKAEEAKQSNDKTEPDHERRYIWLSKGG